MDQWRNQISAEMNQPKLTCFFILLDVFEHNLAMISKLNVNRKWRRFSACDKPGKNVLAGIRIGKSAKFSDDNTLLCDGSHISISSDKPTSETGCERNSNS